MELGPELFVLLDSWIGEPLAQVVKLCVEPYNLFLQQCYISPSVHIDGGLVADVLGTAYKVQGAQGLLGTHTGGADVGNDHGLGITTQGILPGKAERFNTRFLPQG